MHLLISVQPDGENLKALIPAIPYYSLVSPDLATIHRAVKSQMLDYVKGYKREMGEVIKIRKFNPNLCMEVNADSPIAYMLLILDDLQEGVDFVYIQ